MSRFDSVMSYYNVLKIDINASVEEIKKAYKNQARLHHPDKRGNTAQATAKFQSILNAYEKLVEFKENEKCVPQQTSPSSQATSSRSHDTRHQAQASTDGHAAWEEDSTAYQNMKDRLRLRHLEILRDSLCKCESELQDMVEKITNGLHVVEQNVTVSVLRAEQVENYFRPTLITIEEFENRVEHLGFIHSDIAEEETRLFGMTSFDAIYAYPQLERHYSATVDDFIARANLARKGLNERRYNEMLAASPGYARLQAAQAWKEATAREKLKIMGEKFDVGLRLRLGRWFGDRY
jgi:hypothetical protein